MWTAFCLVAAWLLKRHWTLQVHPLVTSADLWNAVVGQEDIDIPSLLLAEFFRAVPAQIVS